MINTYSEAIKVLNLTEKAKHALRTAFVFSYLCSEDLIDTGSLLYGLAYNGATSGELLKKNNVTPEAVEASLKKLADISPDYSKSFDPSDADMELSQSVIRVLARSVEIARNVYPVNDIVPKIGSEHILISLFQEPDCIAVRIFIDIGVEPSSFMNDLRETVRVREFIRHPGYIIPGTQNTGSRQEQTDQNQSQEDIDENGQHPLKQGLSNALSKFGRDMTMVALSGGFDPIIGRDKEILRIIQILSRKSKNNPCLIGEAGVGKTAIIEGLASRIASGNVPDIMKNKRIIQLDMTSVVSGTKFRGEFEERMEKIIEEASNDKNCILFIDEIHTIIGTGGAEGSLDGANILKPALSRSEIHIIGATTSEEYRKYFEKDSALTRRFQPVRVEEPTVEECIDILSGVRHVYEKFHNVKISDECIKACVNLSKRYISDRFLPDKALDVMDEAAALKRISNLDFNENSIGNDFSKENIESNIVKNYRMKVEAVRSEDRERAERFDREEQKFKNLLFKRNILEATINLVPDVLEVSDIEKVVSDWSGIPVCKLGEEESRKLLNLEASIHNRVIGQNEAISAVVKAVRRGRTGLKDPKRPTGSFIFLGPTGVGKTELAKALSECLFGDEKSMIRLDMSEYMESHSVSRMVGSPPGYIGHDEGGQLTEMVRKKPYSVILLDEIEKAHPDVFNILLQILEDGQLTDTQGRTVDFKNTVIIMTSNVGARNITEPKKLGFVSETQDASNERMEKSVMEELKKLFKPEFLNRVDETIVFKPLTKDEIYNITVLQLENLNKRLSSMKIKLYYTNGVINYISEKGFSPAYGARPIRRIIQNEIEDLLAEEILKAGGNKDEGITFSLSYTDGVIKINGKE